MKSLITLAFLVSTNSALAYSIEDMIGRARSQPGVCKTSIEIEVKTLNALTERAEFLKFNHKYCEASAYYSRVMASSDSADQISWAWSQKIESLYFQYDYPALMQEAEQFLKQRLGSRYEQSVRQSLVKAVGEMALEKPDIGNKWFQYALGIQIEQLDPKSFKQNYSLKSFIGLYPNAEETPLLKSWQEQLQKKLGDNLVKEARQARMRRDYVPAIVKYQSILKQGPAFGEFSVCVYELLQTLSEFSYWVEDTNVVSSKKLAVWLMTTEDQINAEMRSLLSIQLTEQRKAIYHQFLEQLPNDTWAAKARQDFQR